MVPEPKGDRLGMDKFRRSGATRSRIDRSAVNASKRSAVCGLKHLALLQKRCTGQILRASMSHSRARCVVRLSQRVGVRSSQHERRSDGYT